MHVKNVFLNINNVKLIKINEVHSETTRIYNPCGYRIVFFFFFNITVFFLYNYEYTVRVVLMICNQYAGRGGTKV